MVVGHGAALVAGIVTVLVVLALDVGWPLALALGGAVAICAGVIAALGLAEREDGRVERIVEAERTERHDG